MRVSRHHGLRSLPDTEGRTNADDLPRQAALFARKGGSIGPAAKRRRPTCGAALGRFARDLARTAMPADPGLERVPAPDVENAPSGWRVAGILRRRNGFRPEISTRGRSARRIRPLAGFAGTRRHVARWNHARRGGDRSSRLAQPARPAAPGGPCCGTASLPSGEFRARSCSGVLLAMIASALI